jgi:hypothetical protein
MHRFIVLYTAPLQVAERFAQVPLEEAQKGVQAWVDWAQRIGDALVDPGRPLGNARTLTTKGVTETRSSIIGMSILQAGSMEDALELVKDHHHLHWAEGCAITVLEEMPIPEEQAAAQQGQQGQQNAETGASGA